jgi:hypothetical protein
MTTAGGGGGRGRGRKVARSDQHRREVRTQSIRSKLGEACGRVSGASGRHLDAARYNSPWQLLRLLWLAVVPVPCGPGERTTTLGANATVPRPKAKSGLTNPV